MISTQPSDEWKLEQGLAPAELALLDQTASKARDARPSALSDVESSDDDDAKADDIAKEEDLNVVFAEEREGWHG